MLAVHNCGCVLALLAPVLFRAATLPLSPPVLVPRLNVLLRESKRTSEKMTVDPSQILLLVKLALEFPDLCNSKRGPFLPLERFLSPRTALSDFCDRWNGII